MRYVIEDTGKIDKESFENVVKKLMKKTGSKEKFSKIRYEIEDFFDEVNEKDEASYDLIMNLLNHNK